MPTFNAVALSFCHDTASNSKSGCMTIFSLELKSVGYSKSYCKPELALKYTKIPSDDAVRFQLAS